ncbi:site-specific integrase [Synechocystis sp. FACHB-383]|uniref:site-specific integrase n=1 Tax=Synechocystis sp. FACHB-383 TaxID=2692864 RepID=UPI0016874002|nr:site-specific integrase [Synechocystis sp. FACHB-383]MBD2653106.1 site-specific integrase [Synechocystis sp. FACHB-383]
MTDPIAKANARLDRVKIRQKNNRLYLRATLPAKDGGERWKQTDVATGCPASEKGYKAALAKAQKMESDLIFERFNWDDWLGEKEQRLVVPLRKNIETIIKGFADRHWEINPRTAAKEKYFYNDYGIAFNQLPLDEPLTVAVLRTALVQSEPGTRARQRNHHAYTCLAKFAGLELPEDWPKLKGNYKPGERRIPSDQEILEVWDRLPPGKWRWAYGMMAAYGIRNHELARLDLDQFPIISVREDSKTGRRLVYPLHKDWPDRLGLEVFNPPKLDSDVNPVNGHRVNQAFTRNKIPFTPYGLRHAYAIRAARLGISPAIVAKWMGHSLSVHYKTYQRWLDQCDFDKVWEGLE